MSGRDVSRDRDERLARALRENLWRRKAQARGRRENASGPGETTCDEVGRGEASPDEVGPGRTGSGARQGATTGKPSRDRE